MFDRWIIVDSAHVLLFSSHNHDLQFKKNLNGKGDNLYKESNCFNK
jgi:hypothetical protein